MKQIELDASAVEIVKMPHDDPDEVWRMLVLLTLPEAELADAFGITGDYSTTAYTMVPLKHNFDGVTNFQDYEKSDAGETVTIEFDDDQFTEVRRRIGKMLDIGADNQLR